MARGVDFEGALLDPMRTSSCLLLNKSIFRRVVSGGVEFEYIGRSMSAVLLRECSQRNAGPRRVEQISKRHFPSIFPHSFLHKAHENPYATLCITLWNDNMIRSRSKDTMERLSMGVHGRLQLRFWLQFGAVYCYRRNIGAEHRKMKNQTGVRSSRDSQRLSAQPSANPVPARLTPNSPTSAPILVSSP